MIGPLLLLALIAVPLIVAAQVRPITYTEYDLANGMHVILHEDHTTPIVTVSVWYHIGSRDEEPGRTGFAHLFEHMMFQGSENVKKQEHFKYIQDVGGTLNASTSADRTNYFETVPSQYLALGLWLESDRMRSLAVTQENFENQLAVVKEERRQRYDNVPYGTMYERMLAQVFHSSGYRWPTIGSMNDLDAATIDDVRAFHAKYYLPNNATLVLSGDVDVKHARELVEEYFGDIPRGVAVMHAKIDEPPVSAQRRHSSTEQVPQPLVAIAFHGPAETDSHSTAAQFLAEMLAGGESSPLYRRLVYEDQIASSVNVHPVIYEAIGLYLVTATVAGGSTPEQVESVIWEELARVRAAAPSKLVVEKVRNGILKRMVDMRSTVFERSQLLSQGHVYFGNASRVNDEWREAESVTADEIHLAAQALDPERSVVFTILPGADPLAATHE